VAANVVLLGWRTNSAPPNHLPATWRREGRQGKEKNEKEWKGENIP